MNGVVNINWPISPKLLPSDLELGLDECKLKIRTNQEPRCVAFSRLVPMPMATQKIFSFARNYFWKLDRRFVFDDAGIKVGRKGSTLPEQLKKLLRDKYADWRWHEWKLPAFDPLLQLNKLEPKTKLECTLSSRCGPVDSFSSIISKLELTLFNAADLLFSHRRFFISAMLSRKLFSVVNWREQFRPTALNTTCSAHAHSHAISAAGSRKIAKIIETRQSKDRAFTLKNSAGLLLWMGAGRGAKKEKVGQRHMWMEERQIMGRKTMKADKRWKCSDVVHDRGGKLLADKASVKWLMEFS